MSTLQAHFPAAAFSAHAVGTGAAGPHLHRLLAEAQASQDARRRREDREPVALDTQALRALLIGLFVMLSLQASRRHKLSAASDPHRLPALGYLIPVMHALPLQRCGPTRPYLVQTAFSGHMAWIGKAGVPLRHHVRGIMFGAQHTRTLSLTFLGFQRLRPLDGWCAVFLPPEM